MSLFGKKPLRELRLVVDAPLTSKYKVIVNGDRNHPYSLWLRTRQNAREYKRILKREKIYDSITIVKQSVTEEGYIWSDEEIS